MIKPVVSLIVGLGNPGDQYKKTRHNAGFLFVDYLAALSRVSFKYEVKFKADCAKVRIEGRQVCLIKPQGYMNKSGDSVQLYAKYFGIPVEEVLVVHDELDLEPGVVRLKKSGGHGGHNGLRDIFAKLSSRDFLRLRFGIGHPGSSKQVADFVLKNMDKMSESKLNDAIISSVAQLGNICTGELQEAMQCLHSK